MNVNLARVIPFKGKRAVNKIEFLREKYMHEEKTKDEKEQSVNIPYFMRAESRINEVKKSGMVESEYNKYKKEV